jgi:predicted nucleotidyltransferase
VSAGLSPTDGGYEAFAMQPNATGTARGPDARFIDDDVLADVLDDAVAALEGARVPFLVMGGIASSILGRHRSTRDVDLFVRLVDADRALASLRDNGFATEVVYPHWLAKAHKGEVTVDVITRASPDILLDDEMLERAVSASFRGRELRLVPPEDLLIMKALAASEDTPRYWYDALGIIGHTDLDWEYVLRRARAYGARRVLAALLYAQSNDLVVPREPMRALFELVMGEEVSA